MKRTPWERVAPASGIVYAVLYVVGMYLLVRGEIDSASDEGIVSHYAGAGTRSSDIAGFILVLIGVLFLLVFVSSLRQRLREAEPRPNILSTLVFGAGVSAGALNIAAATLLGAVSFAAEFTSGFAVDPNLARLALAAGYGLLLGGVGVMCVLVVATSVLALRTSAVPAWLGWVGFAAVILAVVEAVLLPLFVIPVWTVVVSFVLIRGALVGRAREQVVSA